MYSTDIVNLCIKHYNENKRQRKYLLYVNKYKNITILYNNITNRYNSYRSHFVTKLMFQNYFTYLL